MYIKSIAIGVMKIPLVMPFKTALRTIEEIEDVVVMIKSSSGLIGYGSAIAAPKITGETNASITSAIVDIIGPQLIGRDLLEFNNLLNIINNSIKNNYSARAALDIALHDLLAQNCHLPLYKFLGGNNSSIKTGVSIGIKDINETIAEAIKLKAQGASTLKIKAGNKGQLKEDLERIYSIRKAVGEEIEICVDANQGWNVKQAFRFIKSTENLNLNLAMIEQPICADDKIGIKFLKEHFETPIFIDEGCSTYDDATCIVSNQYSDGVAIKLLKAGGIHNANSIYDMAIRNHIDCSASCLFESPIGVAAIASFTAGKTLQFIDIDPMYLIKTNPIVGGVIFKDFSLILPDKPGLGIDRIDNFQQQHEIY